MNANEYDFDDQIDRDAINNDLHSTLFVEAGAGTGKTAALVRRALALLKSGVAMENIAAITFTEKAAAELKYRLREELTASGKHPEALDQLDGAAISTLHGFALRILTQHAIEAGLPPHLEMDTSQGFEDRWDQARIRLLHSPDHEHTVNLARILGVTIRHLRELARSLDASWDIVEERMGGEPVDTASIQIPDVSHFADQFEEVGALGRFCKDPDHKLLPRLNEVARRGRLLKSASDNPEQIFWLLCAGGLNFAGTGNRDDWDTKEGEPTFAEVKEQLRDLGNAVKEVKGQVTDAVLNRLAQVLGQFTLEAARERKNRGVLEFHDLLVLARNLLRDPQHGPDVRRALAQRYQRLLLDEFQDTDPIQVELAMLIAAPPDTPEVDGLLQDEPGRLFYVGDPKQSIYRFRRADIRVFTETGQTQNAIRKTLNRNFRTVEPIIAWINDLFDGFMVPPGPGQDHVQPLYQPLVPVRSTPPTGPSVAVLDIEHPKGTKVGDLRQAEANEVAETVLSAISEEWSVGDGLDDENRDRWRKAQLGDICILLPTRTSLPQIESALQDHAIPYRIEAGSLIWASRAIRDVMAVIRTLADPTDEVALLNALRSPAFGCGDDDLFDFKATHRGSWNFLAALPEKLPDNHPVGQAMTWLRELHSEVRWLNPSVVVERIVRERRLMETAYYGVHRARDIWRSLHLLIDQARQFEESAGRGLREFIAWVDRKIDDRSRESDVILSETDDDAVRISTIHNAKGREFPIVILSGTNSTPSSKSANLIWPSEGGYSIGFNQSLLTTDFAELQKQENQLNDAERVRLLYVALTRARDHLVVSAHRMPRGENSRAKLSMADMVAVHAHELPESQWSSEPLPTPKPLTRPMASLLEWESERDTAIEAAKQPTVVSSSAIAKRFALEDDPGLDKDGDLSGDDRPTIWRAGRYGTKVGRAVHNVLQHVDLSLGGDDSHLDALVAEQAGVEGIAEAKSTVLDLALSVLWSPTVQEAAENEHFKELHVAAPIQDKVVEGYIDLLYRSDDGLVVVDYKTDDIGDPATRQQKIDRYKIQLAAYALAVEKATGEPVTKCVLVFAKAGQPADEELIHGEVLASAKQEVRTTLASLAA